MNEEKIRREVEIEFAKKLAISVLGLPEHKIRFKLWGRKEEAFFGGLVDEVWDPETNETIYVVYYGPENPVRTIYHELAHVYFRYNEERAWKILGRNEYLRRIKEVLPVNRLEEVVARLFEMAMLNEIPETCEKERKGLSLRDLVEFSARNFCVPRYRKEVKAQATCVCLLYHSLYDYYCVLPEHKEVVMQAYELCKIGKLIDAYNVLAEYCGLPKLKDFVR